MKRLSYLSVVALATLLFAVAGSAQAGDGSVRPWTPSGNQSSVSDRALNFAYVLQDFHFSK